MTQEKLSECSDIDVRMVRLIETKGQNVSVNLADAVAKVFGVPLSSMIEGAEALRQKNPVRHKNGASQ